MALEVWLRYTVEELLVMRKTRNSLCVGLGEWKCMMSVPMIEVEIRRKGSLKQRRDGWQEGWRIMMAKGMVYFHVMSFTETDISVSDRGEIIVWKQPREKKYAYPIFRHWELYMSEDCSSEEMVTFRYADFLFLTLK